MDCYKGIADNLREEGVTFDDLEAVISRLKFTAPKNAEDPAKDFSESVYEKWAAKLDIMGIDGELLQQARERWILQQRG